MNRHDLGFVISRALAVWLLAQVGQSGMALAQALSVPMPEEAKALQTRSMLIAAGLMLLYLGIAWLLWFRAGKFSGEGSGSAPSLTGRDLFLALTGAFGMYFLLSGGIGLIYVAIRQLFPPDLQELLTAPYGVIVQSAIEVIVGGIVVILATPGLRQALKDFWRISDEPPAAE